MEFHALGLMSGTSLDGLDICHARFNHSGGLWTFELLAAQTLPYGLRWQEKLKKAVHLSAENLLQLHSEYGFYLGEKAAAFLKEKSIRKIDVIGSHGHTIFHQPNRKFTLQIGDGRALRAVTGLPVVYDFRSQDVLMGGQGAPLVPIGDELLFSQYDACLNMGGFSNISFKRNGHRIAFDICPVNSVLNAFAQQLGAEFDAGGAIAREGFVDESLLRTLNGLRFYKEKPPKSLGIEWNERHLIPLLKDCKPQTALATCTEHAAIQIARVLHEYEIREVLCTGGGAYNRFLLERIRHHCESRLAVPPPQIIEFKEALIFAFMAVLRLLGENNVLSAATGSAADHSSGLFV